MKKLILIPLLATAASPAFARDYTVKMITGLDEKKPYHFDPAQLTVQPGDTVHFINAQDDTHDVMFEAVPEGAETAMSPMLEKEGQSWSYTFTKVGTYKYHCHPHAALGMRGEIIVGHASRPEEMQRDEHHHGQEQGSMDGMEHHNHGGMGDMNHSMMNHNMEKTDHRPGMDHMSMAGFYGSYPMTRESSGTAWLPESSPMEGLHSMYGDWMTMTHGYINFAYDRQGGPRGDEKAFSESMLMIMANRPLGGGTWGLRSMLSLDPAMGKEGYPLLLQTGETSDGKEHLIDRQHPHDLFMELATTYSHPTDGNGSAFIYLGYPGEPALGPATFMHRSSGMDNPEAPITHHWLDSTHITFGVATIGYAWSGWKVEGSVFNGREPDQFRWNFDPLRLNSYSGRITYNPTPDWSLQVSQGFIESPEQLEPDVDQDRTTASAAYNRKMKDANWQTTFAWGLNHNDPGNTTNALLLESAYAWQDKHTIFGRAEWVQKDELFDDTDPRAGEKFNVGKLSIGYVRDIPLAEHVKLGIGGLGSVYALPGSLDNDYGHDPVSGMAFLRLKLQ